jgi:pyruvate dehydrogenase E1 component
MAVILQDGIRRMYKDGESIFYYITVMNEPYAMPAMPGDVKDGILRGMYRYKKAANSKSKLRAQLFGSGAILNEVLRAQEILDTKYGVAADVWSVTSYKELYVDGNEVERLNRLHPGEKPRVPYVTECLADAPGVLVAASDYLKTLPNMISKWMPRRLASLGTDGFGRSEGRASLREFFEVDSRFITLATLHELATDGKIEKSVVDKAIKDLGINPEKVNPVIS